MRPPDQSETPPRRLAFRHSPGSLGWVLLFTVGGLILSTCSLDGYNSALQFDHPDNRPFFVMFGLLGLFLLIFLIANFISAEVRLVDGTVYKRGALRIVRHWPASDFARIQAKTRRLISDGPLFDYVVYVFLLRNTSRALVLSQAWWNVSDIETLAAALELRIPKPTPP